MRVTPLALSHAPLFHQLYRATPSYFQLLGSQVPSLNEVSRDIKTALDDPRRQLALLYDERDELVGSLDYKLYYPGPQDLTINLLLIRDDRQNQGLGQEAIRHLEAHRPQGVGRILASVLGANVRAARFWERLGYSFALDARPAMVWYAKNLPLITTNRLEGQPPEKRSWPLACD